MSSSPCGPPAWVGTPVIGAQSSPVHRVTTAIRSAAKLGSRHAIRAFVPRGAWRERRGRVKNPRNQRPRILLVGPMPPTKGGITTFMLNLMASYLNEEFEFVPYTTTRPPKRDVIDNWGYGAVFRGGPVRILQGILLTIGRFITFPCFVICRRIDLVQIQASDYQVFWEGVVYAILARSVGRPVLLRIGGSFDLFHGGSPQLVQRWIAAALRTPTCVIAQSQFACKYLRRAGRTGDIIVLPNWIRDTNSIPSARQPRRACFVYSLPATKLAGRGSKRSSKP